MCEYTLLAYHQKGSIKWCNGCCTYHLAYNNIFMRFKKQSFEHFFNNLRCCYEHAMICPGDKRQKHFFNTHADGLQLAFDIKELSELIGMVENAQLYHECLNEPGDLPGGLNLN